MSEIPSGPHIKNIQMLESNAKNAPFNIGNYPNSENIPPPVKKKAVRVVEQSTRSDVNLDSLKAWHEKQDAIKAILLNLRIRAYLDETKIDQGSVVDMEA